MLPTIHFKEGNSALMYPIPETRDAKIQKSRLCMTVASRSCSGQIWVTSQNRYSGNSGLGITTCFVNISCIVLVMVEHSQLSICCFSLHTPICSWMCLVSIHRSCHNIFKQFDHGGDKMKPSEWNLTEPQLTTWRKHFILYKNIIILCLFCAVSALTLITITLSVISRPYFAVLVPVVLLGDIS